MSSSNKIIQNQSNGHITNEINIDNDIDMAEQDLSTNFNTNKTNESLTQNVKHNEENKIYVKGINYSLVTLEDALDSTTLSLKESDNILNSYKNNNSDTIETKSIDDIDSIINNDQSFEIIRGESVLNNTKDVDTLIDNLLDNKADSVEENNVEPEFIGKNNLTPCNNFYESKMDTDSIENSLKLDVLTTSNIATETVLKRKIEDKKPMSSIQNTASCNISEHKSSVNIKENIGDDSECSGYNSSDFEFIDEEEAKKVGYYRKEVNEEKKLDKLIVNDYFDTLFAKEESNKPIKVPDGDNLVNLFSRNNIQNSYFVAESKAIEAIVVPMAADSDYNWFNMGHRDNSVTPELREEARKNKRLIMRKCPKENIRRQIWENQQLRDARKAERLLMRMHPLENNRRRLYKRRLHRRF